MVDFFEGEDYIHLREFVFNFNFNQLQYFIICYVFKWTLSEGDAANDVVYAKYPATQRF